MHSVIADRLRDLLERRFDEVRAQWEPYLEAERTDPERDRDHDLESRCKFALIHYRHAFRDEPHLRGLWAVAERAWHSLGKKKDPGWWIEHRFELGWHIVNTIEPMPDEVDPRFDAVCRFHHWILDQLASGAAVSTVMTRFAAGVERFERETWRQELLVARPDGEASNRDERLACQRMAAWLFAQGLDPWNEVVLGNGRADVVVSTGADAVAVEAKVVRPGDDRSTIRKRIRQGMVQAETYANRLNHETGYLVVFWLSDDYALAGPSEVPRGNKVIQVVVVDLRSKPPSELSPKLVDLPEPRSSRPSAEH